MSIYINQALFKQGLSKNSSPIIKYLSYNINQLKQHLESLFEPWMTWENWGRYNSKSWNPNDSSTWTWQIDHIIPQSDLPYTSMADDNFKVCWDLSNLRPYSALLNQSDGAKRIRHKNIK